MCGSMQKGRTDVVVKAAERAEELLVALHDDPETRANALVNQLCRSYTHMVCQLQHTDTDVRSCRASAAHVRVDTDAKMDARTHRAEASGLGTSWQSSSLVPSSLVLLQSICLRSLGFFTIYLQSLDQNPRVYRYRILYVTYNI